MFIFFASNGCSTEPPETEEQAEGQGDKLHAKVNQLSSNFKGQVRIEATAAGGGEIDFDFRVYDVVIAGWGDE